MVKGDHDRLHIPEDLPFLHLEFTSFYYPGDLGKQLSLQINSNFSRQSLKIFTLRVKLSDSIFFLLGHTPIVKLI